MKKASCRVVFGFSAAIFCMVGCGQTGPLYLPVAGLTPAAVQSSKPPASRQGAQAGKQSHSAISQPAPSNSSATNSSTAATMSASQASVAP